LPRSVWCFSIDLGPAARQRAEREATNYLERPMHIGKLKALLWPGSFELDDVVIEGLHKGDQPFLSAEADRCLGDVADDPVAKGALPRNPDDGLEDGHRALAERRAQPAQDPAEKRDPSKPMPFTVTSILVYADRGNSHISIMASLKVVARNLNFDLVRARNLGARRHGASQQQHGPDPELPPDGDVDDHPLDD
jgi:hypothetical protein